MEDTGARSNPFQTDKDLQLSRSLSLKKRVEGRSSSAPEVARPRSRRRGAVLAAVTSVLELADTPLRYTEIKAGVETMLGEPVPASTVKEALAAHAKGPSARFRRVSLGRYELSRLR